ncbi:MAG: type II secretion system F family protein [bacterium]
MINFRYIAKNKDGEAVEGVIEAETESAASKILIAKDIYPIKIETKGKGGIPFMNRISQKDKVFLIRQLATFIKAGLPISGALNTLEEQNPNKKVKEMIGQITRSVEGGSALSVSMSAFPQTFNQIDVTLIKTGEATGSLDKALIRMADNLENNYKIKKKIRSAMAYPAFLLVVVMGVLAVMIMYVLPQMESLYKSFDSQLPLLTRIVLAISHAFVTYGLIFVALIAVGIYLMKRYIATKNGRIFWDGLKLKTPIINNFMKSVYLSRFSRTMAGLVSSGVSILESLNIVGKAVGNVIYASVLVDAAEKVKSGIPLSKPLEDNIQLFPPIVYQMVRVGEQTGEIDAMLDNLATYYDEEVDNFVKSMTSIVEPAMIVFMGVIIGLILVAIMLPIYNLVSVIK